ncbi:Uncharacterized protein TCM_020772 [Theobroma cacao]|uniref:Uncharacterized protein n=1 Tax=Theobroma cacao TaxID=3641 RepID=A0A061EM07_THECC|nr:Uncharacterized protein TCM_020772 [Theobroma cacao]
MINVSPISIKETIIGSNYPDGRSGHGSTCSGPNWSEVEPTTQGFKQERVGKSFVFRQKGEPNQNFDLQW